MQKTISFCKKGNRYWNFGHLHVCIQRYLKVGFQSDSLLYVRTLVDVSLTYLLACLLTYLLTYSMEQSPSWAANWFAASQEIPRISRNPKVHYRTHKRTPPVSILGQPNSVHIPTSHLLEIHPNIIHPSTPRSRQWSLSLRFPQQDPIHPPLKLYSRKLRLKYLCNLARYWLAAPWGWHDIVETCWSVIICEIIVHWLVIVKNIYVCNIISNITFPSTVLQVKPKNVLYIKIIYIYIFILKRYTFRSLLGHLQGQYVSKRTVTFEQSCVYRVVCVF